MSLFEHKLDYPFLRWAEGFSICAIMFLLITSALPAQKPIIKIIEKPVVQIVEKKTIVKVPVKLDAHDKRQIQCLAENTYFEAGNQSTKGKIAVNNVVMNRLNDSKHRFGKTACAVVSQRTGRTCQFSWKCMGLKIRSYAQFAESKRIAEQVYLGNIGDVTRGAKFYHATYVHPNWNLTRIAQIGAHIFYRES